MLLAYNCVATSGHSCLVSIYLTLLTGYQRKRIKRIRYGGNTFFMTCPGQYYCNIGIFSSMADLHIVNAHWDVTDCTGYFYGFVLRCRKFQPLRYASDVANFKLMAAAETGLFLF